MEYDDALRVSGTREGSPLGARSPAPAPEREPGGDIAVIGAACRFAGADDLDAYWRVLMDQRCCLEEARRPEWVSAEPRRDSPPARVAGLLSDIDRFDPLLFQISPREAEAMDPQQRIFLEEVFKALEDAGCPASALENRRVGVFVGVRQSEYMRLGLANQQESAQLFLGNDNSILPARVSHYLNLKGPSLAVDTAASSSLVAVHIARESICRGECDMALAGGVFLMCSPEFHELAQKVHMLSPSGQIRTFDDAADGTVLGEGVGVIVLKRLRDALRDRDRIYGVIKASGVNHDGRTNTLTAPSKEAQRELLGRLYREREIDPATIGYVEAHGTGTKLGDPTELAALSDAFREFTSRSQYCVLGSHKPNIGHTMNAAGIAGLLKVLLSLRHGIIPATIGWKQLNRRFDFEVSPFVVTKAAREWLATPGSPRRAGISSFGFNGTNCHMIVDDAPVPHGPAERPRFPCHVLPVSANNVAALVERLQSLAAWISANGGALDLADVAHTLGARRTHFAHRVALLASSPGGAQAQANEAVEELTRVSQTGSRRRRVEGHGGTAESAAEVERAVLELVSRGGGSADSRRAALATIARLYGEGAAIPWEKLYPRELCELVRVPGYPLMRRRYWLSSGGAGERPGAADHSARGDRARSHAGSEGGEPVAVIGMACNFPQSESVDELWRNLRAERDLVTDVPTWRWDARAIWGDPRKDANRTNAARGGFVREIDRFDARFFGLSPREAEQMDPQQRLVLEATWTCLENAGYRPEDVRGTRTGFYLGIYYTDYLCVMSRARTDIEAYTGTGTHRSIAANRVSYLLDLRGPSEAIDTACSSSITAIHRAVESVRRGECEMAFAAGVNALLSPVLFIAFSKAGMLSPDGACKTFDAKANGYVRGEGVGAILLKPLSKAVAAGDHIHGVILGSAVNHSGRTSSLTAPSAEAQAEALLRAVRQAGVDPTTIGYIEAHGTGTSLGDTTEIDGIKRALAGLYREWNLPQPLTPHCRVGSLKTNIGHLEAASGIAGVIKVLLAMRHKWLPGNIHLQNVNPKIDVERSGLSLMRGGEPWSRLRDTRGVVVKRRAGVNSFGFGGANGHVFLEEYAAKEAQEDPSALSPVVIALSARTAGQLRRYAARLCDWLDEITGAEGAEDGVRLEEVAYTLQVGRSAMAHRLAFVASSFEAASARLREFVNGGDTARGQADAAGDGQAPDAASQKRDAEAEAMAELVRVGDLPRLAARWSAGAEVDWKALYRGRRVKRIPLPTYPFERQRFWVAGAGPDDWGEKPKPADRLVEKAPERSGLEHPIVRRDSSAGALVFGADLDPEAFYLKDHRVNHVRVLPGAVYLEMGLAAAARAGGQGVQVRSLRQCTWIVPIVSEQLRIPAEVRLKEAENGFEFAVVTRDASKGSTNHGGGRIVLGSRDPARRLDTRAIRERCLEELSCQELYDTTRALGFDYGPAFRPLRTAWTSGVEALAELELPPHLAGTIEDYTLHPTMLDGLFQLTFALVADRDAAQPEERYLPFSLNELKVHGPLPARGYGYAISKDGGTGLKTFDLLFLGEEGDVRIEIAGFSLRKLRRPLEQARAGQSSSKRLNLQQGWVSSPEQAQATAGSPNGPVLIFDTDGLAAAAIRKSHALAGTGCIQVCPGAGYRQTGEDAYEVSPGNPSDYHALADALKLRSRLPRAVVHLWSSPDAAPDGAGDALGLDRGVLSLLFVVQALAKRGAAHDLHILYCFEPTGSPAARARHEAVAGFGRTLALEHPGVACTAVHLPGSASKGDLPGIVARELRIGRNEREVLYSEEGRYASRLRAVTGSPAAGGVALRERGVYLITGGLGGLGFILARHLAQKYRASLVLAGRSVLDDERRARLAELRRLGGRVEYVQADVTRLEEARNVVAEGKSRFEAITGVIHAAGVLRDRLVLGKTRADVEAVVGPKVLGAMNLDRALEGEAIEFFVSFSSIVALMGNIGQCDYGYANAFLDAYSRERSKQGSVRFLSINWPLWRDGGMGTDDGTRRQFEATSGMKPLETADGLALFEQALAQAESQFAFAFGDVARLKRFLKLEEGAGEAHNLVASGHHRTVGANS